MIKYFTENTKWGVKAKIDPIEIEHETANSVWPIGQGRRAKDSEWGIYHDTWENAHAHLVAEAEKHVNSARLTLERVKGAQGNVKGMKKPL